MIKISNKTLCCGCGACNDVCPKNCISMIEDDEGFKYPHVNTELCINCDMCKKACPIISQGNEKNSVKEVYASWNKDAGIRLNSTSGGVFTALANTVIMHGGYVIAAQYDATNMVNHICITSADQIAWVRQSKYVQSTTNGIYKEVNKVLRTSKQVLFCGTPCQNAALLSYLKTKPENLILCDFICRGVVSNSVYRKYLAFLEKKYKAKITNVYFKNKTFGWHRFSTKITFDDGKYYIKDRYHDSYMLLYLRENLSLRPSCYNCHFKGIERNSDITLGDFWGANEKYENYDNDAGTSVVITHTDKGSKLLTDSSKDLELYHVDIEEVIKGNCCINESPDCKHDKNKFYALLNKNGYGFIKRKYCKTIVADVVRYIKKKENRVLCMLKK